MLLWVLFFDNLRRFEMDRKRVLFFLVLLVVGAFFVSYGALNGNAFYLTIGVIEVAICMVGLCMQAMRKVIRELLPEEKKQ
jgi:hypothetical protein